MSSTTFSTTPTTDRPWVHEMVIVHRVFRRELVVLPRLVRRASDGDAERAATLAGALRLVLGGLHQHHTGEDAVLWPALLERAAPSTGLVETMQAQHHRVEELLERVEAGIDAWERDPSRAAGTALADTVHALAVALFEHLDLEEREILPLCLRHVTVAEWDSLGEHGQASIERSQLPLLFGAILEECDAAERRAMLGKVPAPVRLLLRTVGAWQYRRYVRRVRGA
ncbi:hemerythrin domain-containing protein [Phycicoccus flavus]|uniref:hemerythrin domain-containing protein n=1 Tax=Phycicoccus flavus TaxID=2502783 RepID=UPI000FEB77C1|nr:hemerythrin domain-containing protein [Phycicoccus flavus]NHA66829.1 hemerythrin domain-containing protein [Phycicoccus flavus]